MALSLPASDSPLRDCFDVADVAHQRWVSLRQAIASAKRTFATSESSVMARVGFLCILADGEVVYLTIGPKGGRKIEWRFGKA